MKRKNASLLITRRAAQIAREKKKQALQNLLDERAIDPIGMAAELRPYDTLQTLLENITEDEFEEIVKR